MRSLMAVALADGGSAARKTWLDRKRRFGHLSWWLPPREIDRNACRALFQQKRTADALETCKLTTGIHPYVWNSWFNLGYLDKQLGNEQAKLATYRCVNEVDPSNHNADAIQEVLAAAGAEKLPTIEGCPVGRE